LAGRVATSTPTAVARRSSTYAVTPITAILVDRMNASPNSRRPCSRAGRSCSKTLTRSPPFFQYSSARPASPSRFLRTQESVLAFAMAAGRRECHSVACS
jgi:hypothetical protein